VIVTVLNRSQFLRAALKSILDQTFSSFEVIVTDDSGKAELESVCASFQNECIRYRANSTPLGVALNIRAAAEEARGSYIAILNDDDIWEPSLLERLVTPLLKNAELVLSFGDHWIILENGQIDYDRSDENSAFYHRTLLHEGPLHDWESTAVIDQSVPLAMAAVFRKDTVDWDLVVFDVGGAYDFWIACLLASSRKPAYYVNQRLSRYRVHDSMETAQQAANKNSEMVFIFSQLIELNFFPKLRKLIVGRYRQALITCGRNFLSFGNASEGRLYFLKALQKAPNPKVIAGLLLTFFPSQPLIQRVLAFKKSCGNSSKTRH
jgi:glycosyltransferase involved in cell wall biosynthesis